MIQYKKSSYRPDIDGLRAIAVLAVVFYHAAINTVRGGFIGVDVFFVISGFLITGILIKTLSNQSIDEEGKRQANLTIMRNIISFYARRVRRIFPVLIIVLISCFLAGWLFMTPDEYELLGKHIAGGSVYLSNIVLWMESGYFDVESEVKPLLHLWSLGIEEQFYIVWPFFILILLKLKFRIETFLFLFVVISCVFNILCVKKHAIGTFYSPPTRFWELAIGGLLASLYYSKSSIWEKIAFKCGLLISRIIYLSPQKGNESQLSKDILSVIGFLMILVPIFNFHTGMHFPGKKALIPTIGAFFLIASGKNALINKKILSLKILVFIGLISYPLYLWHWPLLSFARILYGEVPPLTVRIGLVLFAIMLSWITYRFIEPPLRWGNHLRFKAILMFIILLLLGTLGLVVNKNNGFPERVGYTVNEIQNEQIISSISKESHHNCELTYPDIDKYAPGGCLLQKRIGNTVAIFGDSHAERLFRGMSAAKYANKGVALFWSAGQAPFFDISTAIDIQNNNNRHFVIEKGYEKIFKDNSIKTVVLSHFPYKGENNPIFDFDDPQNKNTTIAYRKSMKKTFDLLAQNNKKVIFVLDNPLLPFSPNICKPRPIDILKRNESFCFLKRSEVESQKHLVWFNSLLKEIASNYKNITLFDANTVLCDKEKCPVIVNGISLYDDVHHLSNFGARIVSEEIIKLIEK